MTYPLNIQERGTAQVTMYVGESFVGDGPNAAHVTTVLGPRNGSVGAAWALAMATPQPGHAPFMVFLQPGLSVQPPTLFVNRVAIHAEVHTEMTLGPAHAGVASGVASAMRTLEIDVTTNVVIANVWVNEEAFDADAVFFNNKAATTTALQNGAAHLPSLEDVIAHRDAPWNQAYKRYKPYS